MIGESLCKLGHDTDFCMWLRFLSSVFGASIVSAPLPAGDIILGSVSLATVGSRSNGIDV